MSTIKQSEIEDEDSRLGWFWSSETTLNDNRNQNEDEKDSALFQGPPSITGASGDKEFSLNLVKISQTNSDVPIPKGRDLCRETYHHCPICLEEFLLHDESHFVNSSGGSSVCTFIEYSSQPDDIESSMKDLSIPTPYNKDVVLEGENPKKGKNTAFGSVSRAAEISQSNVSPERLLFRLENCGHILCVPCLRTYCIAEIMDGRERINCCYPAEHDVIPQSNDTGLRDGGKFLCSIPISVTDVRSLLNEKECKVYSDDVAVDEYEKTHQNRENGQWVEISCAENNSVPDEEKDGGIFIEGSAALSKFEFMLQNASKSKRPPSLVVTCGHGQVEQCFVSTKESSIEESAPSYPSNDHDQCNTVPRKSGQCNVRRELNELKSAIYILTMCKSCPKCSTVMQKNGGCNHMTCRECRHDFSWKDEAKVPNVLGAPYVDRSISIIALVVAFPLVLLICVLPMLFREFSGTSICYQIDDHGDPIMSYAMSVVKVLLYIALSPLLIASVLIYVIAKLFRLALIPAVLGIFDIGKREGGVVQDCTSSAGLACVAEDKGRTLTMAYGSCKS